MFNLPSQIIIILIASLPIGELRTAIPIAHKIYNMPLYEAYFWSVIGNMIPIIFIIWFLRPLSLWLSKKYKLFDKFFEWLFHYTRRKHSKRFEVFEEIALVLFVAVPLPLTGAWSGALASFVFNIPPKKSLPLIFLGVLISGFIVTFITYGFIILK